MLVDLSSLQEQTWKTLKPRGVVGQGKIEIELLVSKGRGWRRDLGMPGWSLKGEMGSFLELETWCYHD
jgi:hypothetical protein